MLVSSNEKIIGVKSTLSSFYSQKGLRQKLEEESFQEKNPKIFSHRALPKVIKARGGFAESFS